MACYRPIVFEKLGFKSNGKVNLKICHRFSGNYEDYRDNKKYEIVPCGKCIGCRLDYANHWAERCSLEASQYKENMFITLTYNDMYVPDKLQKKDFQLFIKRLRNYFSDREIRFFGCGERGSKSGRPHFHIIIFNACFNDLKKHSKNGNNWLFTSPTLEKLRPYGFSTIGEADYASIAYTARYVVKKIKGSDSDEFLLMSRKPGIGWKYFQDHKDKIKELDMIYFPFSDNKNKTSLFRYYKNLIENDEPNYFISKKNDMLEKIYNNVDSTLLATGLKNEFELKQNQELIKKEQIKALKRGL